MSQSPKQAHESGAEVKLDRKELKKPDQFTTTLTDFFNELSKRKEAMIVIVLVIGGVGMGSAWLGSQSRAKTETAKGLLFQAEQAVEKKISALTTVAPPAAGSTPAKKPENTPESVGFKRLDVDKEFADGVKLYRQVVEQYGRLTVATDAKMSLALLYFNHGEFEKAVSLYQQAVESAKSTATKAYALKGLGYALENLGKLKDSLEAYEKALNQGEPLLKGDLLLAKARVLTALNDITQAKAVYNQVISQLPNTEAAKAAQRLLHL